jgi:heme oxygenase
MPDHNQAAHPVPKTPLLERLRAATREQHADLDATVGKEMALSTASYARFLSASLRAVCALEGGVERTLGAAHHAVREALLRSDLAALGVSAPASCAAADPRTKASAFGAAYVLEGSALGGVVLAETVRHSLGPEVQTAYLRLRGGETAARWRWFLSELEAFGKLASERAQGDSCEAAIAGFEIYRVAFAISQS